MSICEKTNESKGSLYSINVDDRRNYIGKIGYVVLFDTKKAFCECYTEIIGDFSVDRMNQQTAIMDGLDIRMQNIFLDEQSAREFIGKYYNEVHIGIKKNFFY